MKNRKMSRMSKLIRCTLGNAGLALAFAGPVHADTVGDNLVNTVTVIDSCYVLATGVDFGVVTTPMVADVPGAVANLDDTGTITVEVPVVGNVDVLTVTEAGVNVICSQIPDEIMLTLGGGATYDLLDTPVTGSDPISGVMTGPGGTLDYEIGFLGVDTLDLPVGVTAAYAGVFLVNPLTTKIPMQEVDGGAGVYTDSATVTVTY